MEKYIIKTRIMNNRYEMIDCEYSYSVGELESFYQGLAIFRGRNLFEKNYDYYIVNENFEDHLYKVFVAKKIQIYLFKEIRICISLFLQWKNTIIEHFLAKTERQNGIYVQ